MELTLQTPSLLFPAISLLLLAYTNRFLGLASLVRNLEVNYRQSHEGKLLDQIHNLKRRLRLIRDMQLAGVLSLFCCTGTMFLLFFNRVGVAEVVFSAGLILMMVSLGIRSRSAFRSGNVRHRIELLAGLVPHAHRRSIVSALVTIQSLQGLRDAPVKDAEYPLAGRSMLAKVAPLPSVMVNASRCPGRRARRTRLHPVRRVPVRAAI